MMRVLSLILGLSLLGLSLSADGAGADTGRRFPHSQISRAEWRTYLNEIKTTPGVEVLHPPTRPETVAYFVAAERSIYYFTTGGPAHPAIAVMRVSESEGKVKLQSFGYFAGDEEAFASWFGSFRSLGPEIQSRLMTKP
jgi:hypothetical protein